MNITMLAGPVIGAFIGYCTNYIAVKMLFRPLKPVMIGKVTLPFTPGIIPKGKDRLARAIGAAVGQSLLTERSLKDKLLSEEMKAYLTEQVKNWMEEQSKNQTTLGELALCHVSRESFESIKSQMIERITLEIWQELKSAGLGEMVGEAVLRAVKEKVHGSLLALMINDSMLDGFREPIANEVETMVSEQGGEKLQPMVQSQWEKLQALTVGEVLENTADSDVDLRDILWNCYVELVETRLSSVWKEIDIIGMIETQISSMDVLEVEQLVLSVMKKELDAVVNLGALIGFILGTLNMFIG